MKEEKTKHEKKNIILFLIYTVLTKFKFKYFLNYNFMHYAYKYFCIVVFLQQVIMNYYYLIIHRYSSILKTKVNLHIKYYI